MLNYTLFQICDPDLKILNVNARYPGARNDYFIWKNSSVHQALKRSYSEGERNTWLIGVYILVPSCSSDFAPHIA